MMEKIFKTVTITGLTLLILPSAWASSPYKVGQAFQMQGEITNYNGREKSAEAVMWGNALKVCEDLDIKGTGIVLNRLSDVTSKTVNTVSSASATFICVPVGQGE